MPNRRDVLKSLAAGAVAGGLAPLMRTRAAVRRPNLLFILSDDHRWDAFGFLDKPWLKTPNLDRIAAEGVHFRNSFVTTSLCSPSRASFLTGQYAHRHGVMNNATPWRDSNVTYMELAHAQGYRTGFFGKWHMPGKGVPDLTGQGKVDRFVSFNAMGGQGEYIDCPLVIDNQEVKSKGYITEVLTDHTLDFLNTTGDDPFCVYLSHKAVHYQFTPPEDHQGQLKDAPLHPMEKQTRRLPMGAIHVPQRMEFTSNQQKYYEALLGVDDSVGRVLGWLDEHGRAEDTVVIYAGDNGYYWGEHGLIDKRYAYEEGLRIPHLMRYPRLIPDGGIREERMVLNVDLAPTMLEAAGIEVPRAVQGASYLNLPREASAPWRRSFLYEYFKDPAFPHPPMEAVRTEDWKLISYGDPEFRDEIYHLAVDPAERKDLIDDPASADKQKELRAELKRLQKELAC